jgi:hypothetical protein
VYEYDAAGNRTARKVLDMQLTPPPAPADSTETAQETTNPDQLSTAETPTPVHSPTHSPTPSLSELDVETIAQTQIKIYPNPATEKIMLEFSGAEGAVLKPQPLFFCD